ncbi:MAG: PAS domain S-box protein [Magnetococcales bacterium]|nr:PAS domain S-box protein [Magnetococcales bacterium]
MKRFRYGVGFRIFMSIAAMAFLTIIASAVGIHTFRVFQDGLKQITVEEMEKMAAAYEAARLSEAIVTSSTNLATANSQSARQIRMLRLTDQVADMKALTQRLVKLGIGQEKLATIRENRRDLAKNLERLNALIEGRLQSRDLHKKQLEEVLALKNRLFELAGQSLFAPSSHSLPPALENSSQADSDSLNSSNTLTPWGSALDRVFELILEGFTATDVQKIRELSLLAALALEEVEPLLQSAPGEQGAELWTSFQDLRQLVTGNNNVFQLGKSQLLLERRGQAVLSRNKFFSDRFVTTLHQFRDEVRNQIAGHNQSLVKFASSRANLLALIALACSGTAIWLLFFVTRGIINRLGELQEAMSRHARGEEAPMPQLAEDEIGEMAHSLGCFVEAIRKREAALSQSEQRLRLAMEVSGAGVYEHAIPFTKAGYFSDRWQDILGSPPNPDQESLEEWTTKVLHPEDWEIFSTAYGALVSGRQASINMDLRFGPSTDNTHHVQWRAMAVTHQEDGEERVKGVVGLILDITERKKIENELRLGRFSFENIHDAVFWITPEGKLSFVNKAACRLLGYSRKELIGMGISEMGSKLPKRIWPKHWPEMGGREKIFFETVARRKDGSVFPVEVNASLLEQPNQAFHLAFIRDISERKRNEGLREAKLEVEAASQAKTAILGTLGHEIRAPMDTIINTGQLLSEAKLPTAHKMLVERLMRHSEVLFSRINNILDFSKITSGEISLEQVPFDLTELVREVKTGFQLMVRDSGVTFSESIDPNLRAMRLGDPSRLRQVLLNLVSNGIKFAPEGRVEFRLESDPGYPDGVRFSVLDSGPGIPQELRGTIFTSFSQTGPELTHRLEGGLGLVICKGLVEQMGGRIWAESEEGKGSGFFVSLPLETIVIKGKRKEDRKEKERAEKKLKSPPMQILMAEDSEGDALLFQNHLKKIHHHLVWVEDGMQAVEHFKTQAFDLILMDIEMPQMDGLAAVQEIRRLEQELGRSPAPIAAVTANATEADRKKCLDAGFTMHMAKPIKKKQFLRNLGRLTHQFRRKRTHKKDN